MSALTAKGDIRWRSGKVLFVPDIRALRALVRSTSDSRHFRLSSAGRCKNNPGAQSAQILARCPLRINLARSKRISSAWRIHESPYRYDPEFKRQRFGKEVCPRTRLLFEDTGGGQ